MAYEASKFGDGSATGGGNVTTQVHNHYGPRATGKTQGVLDTHGSMNELVLDIDAAMVSAEAFPLLAPYIPAGSRIEDVYVEVSEAFVLGGDTPVIEIGTEGSEATNGFTISETIAEALGVYDLTSALSGTWSQSTGLLSNTTIGIDIAAADTPTITAAGKMRVVIRYVKVM
jgi:hypothetical protein